MAFSVREVRALETSAVELQNPASGEVVLVLPEFGGTVQRLRLDTGAGPKDVLVSDDADELRKNPWFRGRLLFPWSDRIRHARYRFRGRELLLHPNSPDDDSAIHGFIYDQPLVVLSSNASEERAEMTLRYDIEPGRFPGYPFRVRLGVSYELSAAGFRLAVDIENVGHEAAPVGFGWHPYFRLGRELSGTELSNAAEAFVEVDAALFPTGRLPSSEGTRYDFRGGRALGAEALDIALVAHAEGVTRLQRGEEALTLEQDPRFFRYVQLFVPPDRRSIAVEPLSAATDAFNRPELGLNVLEPGERVTSALRVVGGPARVSAAAGARRPEAS